MHVIEDSKLVGISLEKQIENLEWWQDIKTNVKRSDLLNSLTKHRPEMKEVILSQNYESMLTRLNPEIEKEVFEFVTSDQDTPKGHLELLGGIEGVFKSMTNHQVKPDFKIFNIMIQVIKTKFLIKI